MTPPPAPDEQVQASQDYLFGLALHGVKLGLDNIRFLLGRAGHPERAYPTVHVAGTNGKGSVVAALDAILRAAGYRTGRFTSPHLVSLQERFLISGAPVSEGALVEHIGFFRRAAAELDHSPTFFEMNTAIAFRHFAISDIDLALVEVGMGGRLDSTNVILPEAAAITNIDLEHTAYLGESLAEIAGEKAGIIKPGIPLVLGEIHPEAMAVILQRAADVQAPVQRAGHDFSYRLAGPPWQERLDYAGPRVRLEQVPLRLAGAHQGANAAVAVAIAETLLDRFPRLTTEAIQTGLAEMRWPCRLERVLESPPVIIDVAHNVAGVRQIVRTLDRCVLVIGVAADKDAARMIALFAPHAEKMICTQFSGTRALPAENLARAAGQCPHSVTSNLREAIALGMESASHDCPLLITGSIYTAGEARRLLIEEHGAPPLTF